MKIYTKTGDQGSTSLYSGERVRKCDARIEVNGALDELNSQLGVALAGNPSLEVVTHLWKIQVCLFKVSADFATTFSGRRIERVSESDIQDLESTIDRVSAILSPLKAFVLPGGSPAAAQIHLARTICRRAERLAFALSETEKTNPLACQFLNRLSDALFCLARRENQLAGVDEPLWLPEKASS